MPTPVISVRNLGKKNRLRHGGESDTSLWGCDGRAQLVTIKGQLVERNKGIRQQACRVASRCDIEGTNSDEPKAEDFWALRRFIRCAESELLGIMGRNGTGKSTFLKVLSRIDRANDGVTLKSKAYGKFA